MPHRLLNAIVECLSPGHCLRHIAGDRAQRREGPVVRNRWMKTA